MTTCEKIAGQWVHDKDMNPATSIMGRRWWARGNLEGTYHGAGSIPDCVNRADLWWHFASQPRGSAGATSPKYRPAHIGA